MRKPKAVKAASAPKAAKVRHTIIGEGTVPCVRVGFGPKAPRGEAPPGCTVVQHLARPTSKFKLRREYKATTASVRTPAKNPPCRDSHKRKGCPVQLAYDQGQPFLRLCHTKNRAGYRLDVNTPTEALAAGRQACADWRKRGRRFVKTKDLGQPRVRKE
jgi:hypothetical protein